LQHFFLERWKLLAEVRELSRQVKGARVVQFAIADQREKSFAGFLRADLNDGMRPIVPSEEPGIAARKRPEDIKGAFMRALRERGQ